MISKRILSVILIPVMTFGLYACRATERYMRAQETAKAAEPLICHKDFGSYRLDPGWVEAGPESGDTDCYMYCKQEYRDSSERPYYLTVRCGADDYAPDKYRQFCNDQYQTLAGRCGEDKVIYDGTFIKDDNYGTVMVDYEYFDKGVHFYQWHVFGSLYHAVFELTVNDEDLARQDDVAEAVFTTVCSLRFE